MIKLYLNDLGIVNCLGNSKKEVTAALLKNDNNMIKHGKLFSGRTTYFAQVTTLLPTLDQQFEIYNCRNNQILASAFEQIRESFNHLLKTYKKERIGIVLGTSTSGINEGEKKAYVYFHQHGKYPPNFDYRKQELGQIACFLAKYIGIAGPAFAISTACTSSGKAFLSAKKLIENDLCDAVIVGGCDSYCQTAINGFDALEAISENICQPFSKHRDGINIGEGAALFILSKEPSAIKFMAGGESSDGYHITSPDPSGNGAALAINSALHEARLTPKDIGYINLHGSATIKNDAMENAAVGTCFKYTLPPTSSTKHLIGHTLGAASAQELGLCWLLMQTQYNPEQILPKQRGKKEFIKDEQLENLNIITDEIIFTKPYFMSNSHAFGGSNVSLIIGKEE